MIIAIKRRASEPQASRNCNQGRRSSGKMCRVGRNWAASRKAPTWKWVSADGGSPSQVKVDPHRAQNPRHRPGDELNLVI